MATKMLDGPLRRRLELRHAYLSKRLSEKEEGLQRVIEAYARLNKYQNPVPENKMVEFLTLADPGPEWSSIDSQVRAQVAQQIRDNASRVHTYDTLEELFRAADKTMATVEVDFKRIPGDRRALYVIGLAHGVLVPGTNLQGVGKVLERLGKTPPTHDFSVVPRVMESIRELAKKYSDMTIKRYSGNCTVPYNMPEPPKTPEPPKNPAPKPTVEGQPSLF